MRRKENIFQKKNFRKSLKMKSSTSLELYSSIRFTCVEVKAEKEVKIVKKKGRSGEEGSE